MKGYLDKKSPTLLLGWQRRFFETNKLDIHYYVTDTDYEPRGTISIKNIKAIGLGSDPKNTKTLDAVDNTEFFIECVDKRVFNLRAETVFEANNWVDCIKRLMNAEPLMNELETRLKRAPSGTSSFKSPLMRPNSSSGARVLDTDSFLDDLNLGPSRPKSQERRTSEVYTFSREFSPSINPYTGNGTRLARTPSNDGVNRPIIKPNSLKSKSPGNELTNKRNEPTPRHHSRETSRSSDYNKDDTDSEEEVPDYTSKIPGKATIPKKDSVSRYETFDDRKMMTPGDFKSDEEERTSVSGCILS